jgi:hypothetical protein
MLLGGAGFGLGEGLGRGVGEGKSFAGVGAELGDCDGEGVGLGTCDGEGENVGGRGGEGDIEAITWATGGLLELNPGIETAITATTREKRAINPIPANPRYETDATAIFQGTRDLKPGTLPSTPPRAGLAEAAADATHAVPFHRQAPFADTAETHCRPSQNQRPSGETSPMGAISEHPTHS